MFRTVTLVKSARAGQATEATLLAATHATYNSAFRSRGIDEPEPLNPGQIVAGKYRVERLLGRGGMGTVYAVRHDITGKPFALKCMRVDIAGSVRAARRFVREARAAGRVQHPNVVEVYDIGQDGPLSYILMEILIGETLSSVMKHGAMAPQMAPHAAVSILVEVLRGISAAHQKGVIHRDIKPDNIFLCQGAGEGRAVPKILDFGIAKVLSVNTLDGLTETGALLGTPEYLSPEQAEGAPDIDQRTDIYSSGVMLYRMLTGELPHPCDSFNQYLLHLTEKDPIPTRRRVPGLNRALDRALMKALARNRDARYRSAEAFAFDLRATLGAASA